MTPFVYSVHKGKEGETTTTPDYLFVLAEQEGESGRREPIAEIASQKQTRGGVRDFEGAARAMLGRVKGKSRYDVKGHELEGMLVVEVPASKRAGQQSILRASRAFDYEAKAARQVVLDKKGRSTGIDDVDLAEAPLNVRTVAAMAGSWGEPEVLDRKTRRASERANENDARMRGAWKGKDQGRARFASLPESGVSERAKAAMRQAVSIGRERLRGVPAYREEGAPPENSDIKRLGKDYVMPNGETFERGTLRAEAEAYLGTLAEQAFEGKNPWDSSSAVLMLGAAGREETLSQEELVEMDPGTRVVTGVVVEFDGGIEDGDTGKSQGGPRYRMEMPVGRSSFAHRTSPGLAIKNDIAALMLRQAERLERDPSAKSDLAEDVQKPAKVLRKASEEVREGRFGFDVGETAWRAREAREASRAQRRSRAKTSEAKPEIGR